MTRWLCIAFALCACNPGTPVPEKPAEPPVPTVADPPPPAPPPAAPVNQPPVPVDQTEAEIPSGMRTYYVVMLRRGPAWTPAQTPEVEELSKGHMDYIAQMADAGKLQVAGPFLGQTDATDYAGIYVYDVASLDEARELAQADPAVAAGRFEPEYLIWMAAQGLRVDGHGDDTGEPAEPEGPPICTDAHYRDFDFWLGEWRVVAPEGEKLLGQNTIEKIHRGCAVAESWRATSGVTGRSVSYWDPARKVWLQTWVDSSGGVITLEGDMEQGSMKLGGTYTKKDGTSTLLRGTWTPLSGGRVKQLFEQSTDGGLSWETWFEGIYERVE